MAPETIIALDAMGGDNAPAMVVRGADIAVERMPDFFKINESFRTSNRESKYLQSQIAGNTTDKKVEDWKSRQ